MSSSFVFNYQFRGLSGTQVIATTTPAANITYYVNLNIGAGNVTGSIVTDGNIGILAEADIVGYNLLLSDAAVGTGE